MRVNYNSFKSFSVQSIKCSWPDDVVKSDELNIPIYDRYFYSWKFVGYEEAIMTAEKWFFRPCSKAQNTSQIVNIIIVV